MLLYHLASLSPFSPLLDTDLRAKIFVPLYRLANPAAFVQYKWDALRKKQNIPLVLGLIHRF